ncbi:hypothetical protein CPC08DRAFT_816466 [Agrocybe pediades]|nr:hypothetical protein CPC08DRAFT_816466 [Agrocybe pediades]
MADSRQADTELLHGNAVLEPSSLQQPPKKSYPVILHVAVLSVFMLPFAMVPYIVARRQNAKLARTVKMLNDDLQRLRSQLEVGSALQQTTQAELRSLAASVSETLKQQRELRAQTSRLESHRSAAEQSTQAELSRLLDELQHSRDQAVALRSLGMSLVDIAAFMEEVELEFGLDRGRQQDGRGIERLRLLALRMQSLPERSM